jgi:hypothetical protein
MRLLWLFGLSLFAACAWPQEPDRTAPLPYQGRGFSATLRKDVSSNAMTPEPSVTLYDFHIGSQPILFIYVGDKPGYPRFPGPAQSEEDVRLPSGLQAHCRSLKVEQGRSGECLIALSPSSPKQLHAFYDSLEPQWANISDAITQSVAPRGP